MVESLAQMYRDVLFQRDYHQQFKEPWKAAELALEHVPLSIREANPWLKDELQKPGATVEDLVRRTEFHPDVFGLIMVAVARTKLKVGPEEAVKLFDSEFPQWSEKFPWIGDRIRNLTVENWISLTTEIERSILIEMFGPVAPEATQ